MKKLLITLFMLIVSGRLLAELTPSDVMDENFTIEVEKAISDFKQEIFDNNGSEIYKKAMSELKSGNVKTSSSVGSFFDAIFSSSDSSAGGDYFSECITRCQRWDQLSYETCKKDCEASTDSH